MGVSQGWCHHKVSFSLAQENSKAIVVGGPILYRPDAPLQLGQLGLDEPEVLAGRLVLLSLAVLLLLLIGVTGRGQDKRKR